MTDPTLRDPATTGHRLQVGPTVAQSFRIFAGVPLVFLLLGLGGATPDILQLLAPAGRMKAFGGDAAVQIAGMLVLCLTQTVATHYAVRLSEQRPPRLREALRLGARRFLPMVGTSVLTFDAIAAGFLLLVVAGVLLALRFSIAAPVCAIERSRPVASMDRSAMLTAGHRWPILGVYVIVYLPMLVAIGLKAALAVRDDRAFEWLFVALLIVWGPLTIIVPAAIYMELRRLKERTGVADVFD